MTDAASPPIVVGRVRKPHGLKGELAVFPLTDDAESVFVVGREMVVLDLRGEVQEELLVEQARVYHREVLVRFRGHTRREAVEGYRGQFLAVARAELAPLEEGEVYQQELVGWAVRDEADEPLGIVSAVYDMPQGTVIEVQGPKHEFLLPFRSEYVKVTDRAGRRLVVDVPAELMR
ncbi:MAG: 16S rRNA processing protein RimM [Gemmatimonadales bacterium]|nr:16S rRNA processing protein RimM [Gemmatimonadales bacterium]